MEAKKIFEMALGIGRPWYISGMILDPSKRMLRIRVDFEVGTRFPVPRVSGQHPVDDIVPLTFRNLSFCQLECEVQVHVPCVRLPDGSVRQVSPAWLEELSELTSFD
jgi:transposase